MDRDAERLPWRARGVAWDHGMFPTVLSQCEPRYDDTWTVQFKLDDIYT